MAQVFNNLSELIQSVEDQSGTETFNAFLNDSDFRVSKEGQQKSAFWPTLENLQNVYDDTLAKYDSAGLYPVDSSAGAYINLKVLIPLEPRDSAEENPWLTGGDCKRMSLENKSVKVQ